MSVTVNSGRLDKGIRSILHAVSRDYARPILTCALFEGDSSGFRVVGADNYRIAIADLEVLGGEPEGFGRAAVPSEELNGIKWLLRRQPASDVTLSHQDARLTLTAGSRSLTVDLLDGTYPNYAELFVAAKPGPVMGLNPAYLTDVGRALRGQPVVRVEFRSALLPLIVTAGDDGEAYREAIMPVRIVS